MSMEAVIKQARAGYALSDKNERIGQLRKAFEAGLEAYRTKDHATCAIPPYDMDTQPELWQSFIWGVEASYSRYLIHEARGIAIMLAEGL